MNCVKFDNVYGAKYGIIKDKEIHSSNFEIVLGSNVLCWVYNQL